MLGSVWRAGFLPIFSKNNHVWSEFKIIHGSMSNQKPSTGHPSEIEGWVNLRGFATSSLVGGYDHSTPILFWLIQKHYRQIP